MFDLPVLTPLNFDNQIAIVRTIEKPQPNEYLVIDGDNLTKIAEKQATTVARLWAKNADLQNQDLLVVGQKLLIPTLDEELPDRPLYTIKPSETIRNVSYTGFSTGNSYSYGWCTWFVKNLRPDLPNNLGNASAWFYNAQSQGLIVGTTPQVGAVAVTINYAHVSIVTAVHGSTVTVSEMNFVKWNVISTRIAPISEFNYIY